MTPKTCAKNSVPKWLFAPIFHIGSVREFLVDDRRFMFQLSVQFFLELLNLYPTKQGFSCPKYFFRNVSIFGIKRVIIWRLVPKIPISTKACSKWFFLYQGLFCKNFKNKSIKQAYLAHPKTPLDKQITVRKEIIPTTYDFLRKFWIFRVSRRSIVYIIDR